MNSCVTDILPDAPGIEPASGRLLPALFIGYGNMLRADDGVGPDLAAALAEMGGGVEQCRSLIAHQLNPEHAEALQYARRVIFIDASVAVPPGKIRITRLHPDTPSHRAFTHSLSPNILLAIAQSLFGRVPQAWSIAVGVADLSYRENLSPLVAQTAQRLLRHLAHRARSWSATASALPSACKEGSHVRS